MAHLRTKLSLLYQFAARYDVDVYTVQCALTPVKYRCTVNVFLKFVIERLTTERDWWAETIGHKPSGNLQNMF